MTETDATTGLPVVPEGHFWRVSRAVSSNGPVGYVCLMKKSTRTVTDRVMSHVAVPDPVWYNKNRTRTSSEWTHVERDEEYNATVRTLEISRYETGDLPYNNITADDIWETATELLSLVKRTRAVDALMGDYPPKTLDTDD